MRRCLDECVAYAKERKTFGVPIAQHQLVQAMIAEMAIRIEATSLLVRKAAWSLDKGIRDPIVSRCAKAFGADAAMQTAIDAVQVFGGNGYVKEYPVEKLMRDAKILQIYEGTAQIQRIVIAPAGARRSEPSRSGPDAARRLRVPPGLTRSSSPLRSSPRAAAGDTTSCPSRGTSSVARRRRPQAAQGYEYVARRPLAVVALAEARGIDAGRSRGRRSTAWPTRLDACATDEARSGGHVEGAARVDRADRQERRSGGDERAHRSRRRGRAERRRLPRCADEAADLSARRRAPRGFAIEALWGRVQPSPPPASAPEAPGPDPAAPNRP